MHIIMEKIAVVYWSGTGNTEQMANAIADGIKEAGAQAELFTPSDFSENNMDSYTKLAFGCPSMGAEQLEESEFEPMFSAVESKLVGKKIALFGSYDWGDGEWMRTWQEQTENAGASMVADGLIVNNSPDEDDLTACVALGKTLATA